MAYLRISRWTPAGTDMQLLPKALSCFSSSSVGRCYHPWRSCLQCSWRAWPAASDGSSWTCCCVWRRWGSPTWSGSSGRSRFCPPAGSAGATWSCPFSAAALARPGYCSAAFESGEGTAPRRSRPPPGRRRRPWRACVYAPAASPNGSAPSSRSAARRCAPSGPSPCLRGPGWPAEYAAGVRPRSRLWIPGPRRAAGTCTECSPVWREGTVYLSHWQQMTHRRPSGARSCRQRSHRRVWFIGEIWTRRFPGDWVLRWRAPTSILLLSLRSLQTELLQHLDPNPGTHRYVIATTSQRRYFIFSLVWRHVT